MCDPVSAMFVVSAGIGAAGALSAGAASSKAHSANAGALEIQKTNRMEKAKFDVAQQERHYTRVSGERDARIGTTGLTSDSFSDIRADDAAESALEQAATLWSAQNDANMLQFQVDAQRREAKAAKTASYFNAAGAVVSAAGGYAKSQGFGVKTGGTFSPDTAEEAHG